MTTKTKDVRIGSIKLVDGGNKGLVVKYAQTEYRNNREFVSEFTVTKKFPIHEELNNVFTWLKPYLLDICNYTDKELLASGTEITGISYGDNGFVISGKLSTIGDKVFALNTPLITAEDGYGDFGKVCSIMDGIYSEAKEYMEGKKVLSDVQYVINLNKSNADFDIKTFNDLPEAEQWKIATEFMTKNKMMAVSLGDIELDLEGETGANGPEDKLEKINTPFVQVEEHLQNQPETTLTTYEFSDETFIIPEEPVKISTAKKKAKA